MSVAAEWTMHSYFDIFTHFRSTEALTRGNASEHWCRDVGTTLRIWEEEDALNFEENMYKSEIFIEMLGPEIEESI